MFLIKRLFNLPRAITCRFSSSITETNSNKEDELFKKIELELRGHDKQVLTSYSKFVMVNNFRIKKMISSL